MTSLPDHADPADPADARPDPPLRLQLRRPDDLIATARVVLGFTPCESVVMLTFGAANPFHARIDLPDPTDPPHPPAMQEIADLLLEPAERHGAAHLMLLVCTDDVALGAAAWAELDVGCRERGLVVSEALLVTSTTWSSYLARGPAGHRAVPYDVSAHPFVVRGVVAGRVTHASRDELAATLAPDPVRVADVGALLARLDPLPPLEQVPREWLLDEGAWVRRVVARHVRDGTPVTDREAARLVRAVRLPRLRDAAWTLVGRADAQRHLELWVDVLRRSPPPFAAAPAVLLGWAAWLTGNGALAWCGVDRCLAVDADHALARLLGRSLAAALPPSDWSSGLDWTEGL